MIPTTGVLTASAIATELGRSAGSAVNLDEPGCRMLTRNSAKKASGGVISMNDLRGGTGYPMPVYMPTSTAPSVRAYAYARTLGRWDGVNAIPLGTVAGGYLVREIGTDASKTYVVIDNASPPYDIYFWGVAIYTSANTPIGSMRYAQADSLTSAVDASLGRSLTTIGWTTASADYVDLRPYHDQWLNFVFAK